MTGPTETEPVSRSLEHDFRRARKRLLRRSADAADVLATVRRRLEVLTARTELLSALAEVTADDDATRERVATAVETVEELRRADRSDADMALELAVGMLATGRAAEAVALLRTVTAGRVDAGELGLIAPWLDLGFDGRQRTWRRVLADLRARTADAGRIGVAAIPEWVTLFGRRHDQQDDRESALERVRVLIDVGELPPALDALNREIESTDSAAARNLRAEVLERLGRHQEALTDLDEISGLSAMVPDALARRIRLLTVVDDAEVAVGIGRSARSLFPEDATIWLAFLRALAAAGHTDQALSEVSALEQAGLEAAAVQTLKGELLRASGEPDEALTVLTRAAAEFPDDVDCLATLARMLADKEDFAGALQRIDSALAVQPFRIDLELERVRLLLRLGQSFEATEALDKVQQQGASGHGVAALRATVYEQLDRPDEAAEWYARALTETRATDRSAVGAYAGALERLAERLFEAEDYDTALTALDTAQRARELSLAGKELRAELLRMSLRWSESLAQADEALSSPERGTSVRASRLYGTKAQVLVELSRSKEALTTLDEAFTLDPDYRFGRHVRIVALCELDRFGTALAEADRFFPAAAPPDGWEVWSRMAHARLLAGLGRYREADDLLRSALGQDDDPELHGALGYLLNRAGRPAEAVAELRAAGVTSAATTINKWALVELADAMVSVDGERRDEATEIYRSVDNAATSPTPTDKSYQAWALFRLGQADASLALYREAFEEAVDPLWEHRMRFLATCAAAGRQTPEAAELLRTMTSSVEGQRGAELLREGLYGLRLLVHDPRTGAPSVETAELEQALQRCLQTIAGPD